ncbi:MAG: peptidoglycan editing factor PgeF [Bdellovibrionales bacterium]|nr:peptidoglycan editing factor PgeF [Ramlibacter sp.]
MHGWLAPDWPAPAKVRAVCTTRAGGVSTGLYDSLNLGGHVGDAAQAVAANRQAFKSAIGVRPVFLEQVHGTRLIQLIGDEPDGLQADACATTRRGVACTIMVADCLPVLLTNEAGTTVAAAHAGWRGLAQGVLDSTLAQFAQIAGTQGGGVMVWLGPCIGPAAFEVGDEVKAVFEVEQGAAAGHLFKPHTPGKWMADLQGLARLRLQRAGVTRIHGNDGSAPWCTVGNPSQFFSHRRDGVSGRFAASIWLD